MTRSSLALGLSFTLVLAVLTGACSDSGTNPAPAPEPATKIGLWPTAPLGISGKIAAVQRLSMRYIRAQTVAPSIEAFTSDIEA